MIRPIAALFTAAVFFGATACFAAPHADLVFVNGAVYTVDAARSWGSALVVTGEQITYVGDDATARTFIGPATRVIDLQHRMLLPGFQDSHVHPGMVPNPATSLDLHGLTRRDQILARIRQYADSHPDVPWIVGDGWDEVAFEPSRMPTREELDAVVADRPAFLTDNSGHDAWVNSRTLAAAGITAASADPPNGRIERGAHGQPTGLLHEDAAMDLVVPLIPPKSAAEQLADLEAALHEMTRLGFTALEDAMATPPIAAAFKTLDRQGALQQRVNLCLPFQPEKDDETQVRSFLKQRAALSGRWLRATCVKLFIDGAAAHTVALLQPYSDAPALGRGNLFIEQARLDRLVARLDAAGFQVHMHAQGDWAVRAGLDSFEEARRINGIRDNRHTIAHLWLVDPADISRFRSLSVIPNMTPVWSLGDTWETVDAPNMFGPDRSRHLFPTRSLLDAGAMLVWGSDWPVTGVSPLDGIETAITHRYPGGRDPFGIEDHEWHPEERVSLERAIVAYTSTGAYLMHDEATRGTLAPGKRADLVVLHRNLFETAAPRDPPGSGRPDGFQWTHRLCARRLTAGPRSRALRLRSAVQARSVGIEQRLRLQPRREKPPQNLNAPAVRFVGDLFRYVTQRDRQLRAVRKAARGHPAAHRAVPPDRLIADRIRVVDLDHEDAQPQFPAACLLARRAFLADEGCLLAERDEPIEACLERAVQRPILARPRAVALLEAQ